jgi:hypothetical protein
VVCASAVALPKNQNQNITAISDDGVPRKTREYSVKMKKNM